MTTADLARGPTAAFQLLIADIRLAVIAATAVLAMQGDQAVLVVAATLCALPLTWLLRRPRPRIDSDPTANWAVLAVDLLVTLLALAAAGTDSLALVYAAMTCALAGLRLGRPGVAATVVVIGVVHLRALFDPEGVDLVVLVLVRLGLVAVTGFTTVRLRDLLASRERLLGEVRRLEAEGIREQERLRLARDMHDSLAKTLHGAVMLGRRLARRLEAAGHTDAEDAAVVLSALGQAQDEARELLANLREDNRGTLSERLSVLAQGVRERSALIVRVSLPEVGVGLPVEAVDELVKATAELLENVERHSGASSVAVRLAEQTTPPGPRVRVEVVDDGRGLPGVDLVALSRAGHFGLVGVNERMARVGGSVTVGTAGISEGSGPGTRAELSVPLQRVIDLDAAQARGVVPRVAPAWGG